MSEFEFRHADTLDPEGVKRALPLAYAARMLGIMIEDGRAVCPFHADTNPSLRMYVNDADGIEKWSCDPCGLRARDLFDLIMRARGCSFPQALAWARDQVANLPPGTTAQAYSLPAQRKAFDQAAVDARRLAAQGDGPDTYGLTAEQLAWRIAQTVGIEQDGAFSTACGERLVATWGWGIDLARNEVWMPHWTAEGVMTGCKIRTNEGQRRSVDGSKYEVLYGAWLPRQHQKVLLTEGETDAVWADWAAYRLGLPLDVRALPSGATSLRYGSGPASVFEMLRGVNRIYLAFDPDDAGQAATRFWYEQLEDNGFGGRVRLCRLPRGLDLRDARPDLKALLDHARPRRIKASKIVVVDGMWYVPGRSDGAMRTVATWSARPVSRLVPGPGEDKAKAGHEVAILKDGVEYPAILTDEDMRTRAGLTKWATANSIVWHGTEGDAAQVGEKVFEEDSYVPEVYITSRVGVQPAPPEYAYAGPSLVLPNGVPKPGGGKLPWVYASRTGVDDRVAFPDGGATAAMVERFLALGPASLTTPVLAWMAASARRHELAEFPLLFVSGPSGSGKSTISRIAAAMMGSGIEGNLAQLTPFVLLSYLSSTSTLPVFLDEYTRQSGPAVDTFRANVPAIYTGGLAMRGEATLDIRVFKMTSPVIVAGENLFTNTREVERSIVVEAVRERQNYAALAAIQDDGTYRQFALAFNRWLIAPNTPRAPLPQVGVDRTEYNRNVLRMGWDDLHNFCADVLGWAGLPPEVDFVTGDEQLAEREDPYEDAVRSVLSDRVPNRAPLVIVDEHGTLVQFAKIVRAYEVSTGEKLPGGGQAMERYFKTKGYAVVPDVRVYTTGGRTTYKLIKGWWAEPYEPDIAATWAPGSTP